jgi:capsule polysaccharide export protein KpsE/RkpR
MEKFKTENILQLLLPHWKKLLIVGLSAVVFGFIISSEYIIKPLYKSYAIVYPVNLSPSSEESTTEQLLQWFNSEEIKVAVAKKFKLYNHYHIDTLDKRQQTFFNLKYKELVSINSTLYESIEISVKDESPEMAKKMVQGIIDATNDLITNVKRERVHEYLENNEIEMEKQIRPLDSLKKLIVDFRENYNIVDFGYQAKALVKKQNKGQVLSVEESKTIEAIKSKEKDYNRITTNYDIHQGTFNYHKAEVNKFKFENASVVAFTNVVSRPTLPDSKCYPIRSLIVAIITISSLLIASLYILFSNLKSKKID